MINPIGNRVVIEKILESNTTEHGILISTKPTGLPTDQGIVKAIGPTVSLVEVGNKVIYSRMHSVDLNENLFVIVQEEIMAVIE